MHAKPIHTAEEIAAFLSDGETRLIAAGYQETAGAGQLFVLPHGAAHAKRTWVKSSLRCMFADCPSPSITTVARPSSRDGFRHISGARKHAPESVSHRQGKAVIAAWLGERFGRGHVVMEGATDTQRKNIADVLLSHPSVGHIALEVQYSPLTVSEWKRRHDSYAEQGIVDVWLWGHTRLRQRRGADDRETFRLDDVQQAAGEAGAIVAFLNPEREEIAIAVNRFGGYLTLAMDCIVEVVVLPLSRVSVDRAGLSSTELLAMKHARHRLLAQRAELRERARAANARRIEQERLAEEQRTLRELRARLRAAAHRSDSARPGEDGSERPTLGAEARGAAGERLCRVCYLPLAEVLYELGVHPSRCQRIENARSRRGEERHMH